MFYFYVISVAESESDFPICKRSVGGKFQETLIRGIIFIITMKRERDKNISG